MSIPEQRPALETEPVPTGPVRRNRRAVRLIGVTFAVVALMVTSSACQPRSSRSAVDAAISDYWGPQNTPCARRIVQRESNFQPAAVNPRSGTTGLFQIHPVHASWIRSTFGYSFSDMKDARKNSRVAKYLSSKAYAAYGDGWQPWRLSGRAIRGGGCPV